MIDYNELFGTKKKDDKKETNTFSDTFGIGGKETKQDTVPTVKTGDTVKSDSVFSFNPKPSENLQKTLNQKYEKGWILSPDLSYDTDYSLLLHHLMGSGASTETIREVNDLRQQKIASNPELSKYNNDQHNLSVQSYLKLKERTEGKAESDVERMLRRLSSRKKFSYDPEKDELYQSLKSQALKRGQKAMDDTMSRVVQNAGGNNSYAISAAQGAYNDYLSGVDDLIPQLEQLAYSKYQNEVANDKDLLNLYMAMEEQEYNRNLQQQEILKNDYWTAQQWAYQLAQNDEAFNMQLASYGITPSGNKEQDIKALAEAVALEKLASKKGSTVKGGEVVDDLDENELFEGLLIDKGKEGDSQTEEERIAKILNPFLKYEELVEKEANKDNGKIDVPYVGKISTEEALALIKSGKAEYVINEDGSIEFRLKDKGLLGAGNSVTGFMTKNFLDKITG